MHDEMGYKFLEIYSKFKVLDYEWNLAYPWESLSFIRHIRSDKISEKVSCLEVPT